MDSHNMEKILVLEAFFSRTIFVFPKIQIFNMYIVTTLTYGSQIWSVSKKDEEKNKKYTKCYRKIDKNIQKIEILKIKQKIKEN